jgi:excisionase family DNA binding protein
MSNLPSLEDPFLTVPQVAEIFAVRTHTIRLWMREGKLEGRKLPGGQWRILQSEVTKFAQAMYGDNSNG